MGKSQIKRFLFRFFCPEMSCQNGEAVGLPRYRDCIFMQGVSDWGAVCKLLFYRGLWVAFQKFNFQRAKVELLGAKSSTFGK